MHHFLAAQMLVSWSRAAAAFSSTGKVKRNCIVGQRAGDAATWCRLVMNTLTALYDSRDRASAAAGRLIEAGISSNYVIVPALETNNDREDGQGGADGWASLYDMLGLPKDWMRFVDAMREGGGIVKAFVKGEQAVMATQLLKAELPLDLDVGSAVAAKAEKASRSFKGMIVVGSDGARVGTVERIDETAIVLDRVSDDSSAVAIPFSSIAMINKSIVLRIDSHEFRKSSDTAFRNKV